MTTEGEIITLQDPWHVPIVQRCRTANTKSGRSDTSVISALAALGGAVIGGLTSLPTSWLTTRTQARAQWLGQDILRRQDVYKEFIEEASQCHVHALQHDKPDVTTLVRLYALIARMRVLSSPKVIASAERIARTIIDTYLQPDKTFQELRDMFPQRVDRPPSRFQ